MLHTYDAETEGERGSERQRERERVICICIHMYASTCMYDACIDRHLMAFVSSYAPMDLCMPRESTYFSMSPSICSELAGIHQQFNTQGICVGLRCRRTNRQRGRWVDRERQHVQAFSLKAAPSHRYVYPYLKFST